MATTLQLAAGRIPPHDLDAETSVLGSILIEPLSIVIESAAALVPPLRKYVSAGAARMKGVSAIARRSTPQAS